MPAVWRAFLFYNYHHSITTLLQLHSLLNYPSFFPGVPPAVQKLRRVPCLVLLRRGRAVSTRFAQRHYVLLHKSSDNCFHPSRLPAVAGGIRYTKKYGRSKIPRPFYSNELLNAMQAVAFPAASAFYHASAAPLQK